MLLTRAPLYQDRSPFSCDLHVLGAPLTFVLSQDQTLQLNLEKEVACPVKGGLSYLAFAFRRDRSLDGAVCPGLNQAAA